MVERYIYRFTVGNDGRSYIGNPYLKPEINNQMEISVRKHWDKIAFGTGIYYSYLQDYITPILTPALISDSGGCGGEAPRSPKQYRNVNAYQYGFDFDFSYRFFPGLTLRTGGAWTQTYNITLHEPLAQIAPPSAHAGILYKKDKYSLDLTSEMVAAQENYATSFGESATPGHITLYFRAVWKPLNGLSVGAAVLNMLDEAYYNHVNFGFVNADEFNGRPIYEPGRSFSTYIKYQF
jgi:iron complex outermembrane receptor protein